MIEKKKKKSFTAIVVLFVVNFYYMYLLDSFQIHKPRDVRMIVSVR